VLLTNVCAKFSPRVSVEGILYSAQKRKAKMLDFAQFSCLLHFLGLR